MNSYIYRHHTIILLFFYPYRCLNFVVRLVILENPFVNNANSHINFPVKAMNHREYQQEHKLQKDLGLAI